MTSTIDHLKPVRAQGSTCLAEILYEKDRLDEPQAHRSAGVAGSIGQANMGQTWPAVAVQGGGQEGMQTIIAADVLGEAAVL
jgi:hypothetical protein